MMDFFDKKIIGITGTQGSGKDTAAEFLARELDYQHFSLSDIVREETNKLGLEHTRDNWREVADSLRSQFGNGVLAIKMIEKIKNLDAKGFIITSFRHPDEVSVIKKSFKNFKLISIDANIDIRYQRIIKRGKVADQVSMDNFKEQEKKENVTSDVGMRIQEVIGMSDVKIINDGDLDSLYNELKNINILSFCTPACH